MPGSKAQCSFVLPVKNNQAEAHYDSLTVSHSRCFQPEPQGCTLSDRFPPGSLLKLTNSHQVLSTSNWRSSGLKL